MVNSKKYDILERYRNFLENNLVLTDNFLRWFKEKRVLPDFILDDIQAISSSHERNRKFLSSIMDNGDNAFTRLVEGLATNGQPFLGELLESEDKKVSEVTADASEQIFVDDDMLKKCPGIDKVRGDTREKLKTYLQSQLLKAHMHDTWKSQNQSRSVEIINLKRQHYENQQKLSETLEEERRIIANLKSAVRSEQLARQAKEDEINELRRSLEKLQADFDSKWSGQIKMVDANNRSLFKMNDKMAVLTDWLSTLDNILEMSILQCNTQYDTVDQLHKKLRQYTAAIESLRLKGSSTEKIKDELYESLFTSRYLPIEDRKNKPFYDLLVNLYGSNQVSELSQICTKDSIQAKSDRDQANEIRQRDLKIDELNRLNRDLREEIERLKQSRQPTPAPPIEQSTNKPSKPQWRPVPASITPREKPKARQALKPASVQFSAKPGTN